MIIHSEIVVIGKVRIVGKNKSPVLSQKIKFVRFRKSDRVTAFKGFSFGCFTVPLTDFFFNRANVHID